MNLKFGLLIPILFFAIPYSASAGTCCACKGPSTEVCINFPEATLNEVDCGALQEKSNNSAVKSLNCPDAYADNLCKPVSNNGRCVTGPFDASTYTPKEPATTKTKKADEVPAPVLGVQIPNLEFSKKINIQEGYLYVPYFAQYVSAIYKYLAGIGIIAAAIMIMYGGFKYIVSATGANIKEGKAVIIDALIGLILILGAYTLLDAVNPSTTAFDALKITLVRPSDYDWIEKNGTADRENSSAAIERAQAQEIPYTGETVNIEDIEFDKSLGGPENMGKYCSSKEEIKNADTYEKKVNLLVKVVLGWNKVCVENGLCVYVQGGGTGLGKNATISATPNASYVASTCKAQGIKECRVETLFPAAQTIQPTIGDPTPIKTPEDPCLTAYKKNPNSINAMSHCRDALRAAYTHFIIKKYEEAQLWGGDCGSFAFSLLACARVQWDRPPRERGKFYLSPASVGKFDDQPGMIVSAMMNQDVTALAAKKGGIKFGDLVYITAGIGGNGLHWAMYTGGRPDIPFSFIEMGGLASSDGKAGVVSVPGLSGNLAGVVTQPSGMTLQDYIDTKTKSTPLRASSGRIWGFQKPTYQPDKAAVFVWRPYSN